MSEAVFEVPFLFTLFCAMAGAAVWLAAVSWLLSVYRGKAASAGRLRASLGRWLARVIVLVAFVSIGLSVAEGRGWFFVLPEIFVVFLSIVIFTRQSSIKNIFSEVIRTIASGFAVAALWGISIALGWGMQVTVTVPGLAVFAVALLWVAAPVLLYNKARLKAAAGTITLPERFSFPVVVWTLLLVCAILILPVLLDHIAHAPTLREMLEAGPPLRRA